jgi:hypothetical protein
MMTPQQLSETLASTRFGGRQHVVLERGGGAAVAVQIDPAEARAAWLEARALLDITGRWPVAVTGWSPDARASWSQQASTFLDPRGYAGEKRSSLEAILEQAESIDLDAALTKLEDDDWNQWLQEEATGEVSWAAAEMAYWFEPGASQPTAMVFLPTARSAATVAYESWYAENPRLPAAALVALLERWNAAYGAEVMAHWGTMLQVRVERPPHDIVQARALAREQLLVAPCTAIMPGTHPEVHAQALLQAKTWFLHERP